MDSWKLALFEYSLDKCKVHIMPIYVGMYVFNTYNFTWPYELNITSTVKRSGRILVCFKDLHALIMGKIICFIFQHSLVPAIQEMYLSRAFQTNCDSQFSHTYNISRLARVVIVRKCTWHKKTDLGDRINKMRTTCWWI